MRREIQYAVYILTLGASLIVYAHASFVSKETVQRMAERIKVIDQRVYEIHRAVTE